MIDRTLVAIAGALLLAGCGGANTSSPKATAAGPYVKAHSVKQLMANVVEVQAQLFWRSAGSITDANGQQELAPAGDEGWQATRSAAATVAEMGNLLMTPLYAEGRGEDWTKFAQAMVRSGMRAERAAAERNSDAVFETGGALYETCQGCHQVYIKDPASPAQPATPS
ncbi:MAG: hypothetical protein JWM38_44 [Sphingomonas bacterium]|nr:hypothetical protein [Sphingomonas bacterium]MDB5716617.1 hypothetical protein [Sphingomonas bacterium]